MAVDDDDELIQVFKKSNLVCCLRRGLFFNYLVNYIYTYICVVYMIVMYCTYILNKELM